MRFIGRYAEHLVLAHLLEMDLEAYLAIRTNQDDYDITVIRGDGKVLRLQVKATELENDSTNNGVGKIDKRYDFLVIVILTAAGTRFFVLSREQALQLSGSRSVLYTSYSEKNVYYVRAPLSRFENNWQVLLSDEL